MTLNIILFIAVLLSIGFHFIGVYVNAKKTIWLMIALMWIGSLNIAMSEVKPKAYEDIKKIEGKYSDVDALIEDAKPEISLYEMLLIKKAFVIHEPKK